MVSVLPVQPVFPLYGVVITLRFTEKTQLSFFHQPSLTAFIRFLLEGVEGFEYLLRIDACESGRVEYLKGDLYRFSIIGLKGCLPLLDRVVGQLSELPVSAPKQGKKLAFGENCQLVSVIDLFVEQPVSQISELQSFNYADLVAEAELWQQYSDVSLSFYSPVRWLKEKSVRDGLKGELRFCRQKSDLSASLVSDRFFDTFSELLKKHGVTSFPLRSDSTSLPVSDTSHLFWLDCFYTSVRDKSKPMPMGGMVGELCLSVGHFTLDDWLVLVLAQYVGVGQRCAFGWGRFQLKSLSGEVSCRRVFAASSLLQKVVQQPNLVSAFAHVESHSKQGAFSADEDASEGVFERLQTDVEDIYKGQFKSPSLQGFVINKSDGSPRPLAVPPFRDRVLQRAVAQVLTPPLESIQYQRSYGFRPGRSRITAKYAIQSAWREGYRWVYESDIDDFFDSVCWQRLAVRLRALWGEDPLVGALLAWVKADVIFEGQLIKRNQGLPQGSPLSPLLANLMLDDFDNDMQAEGFRLIRYADDFVVLCKSEVDAKRAHEVAELSLREHGLQLDKAKTNITLMENGFHYLGYLFVNDMVLESPNRLPQGGRPPAALSPNSWLAKLGARQPVAIEPSSAEIVNKRAPAPKEKPAVVSFGERIGHGLLLCVTGQVCVLSTKNQRLQLSRNDALVYDVPWRHLQAVLVMGRHHITSPALRAAMKFKVPVHFTSATGKYEGVVWSGEPGARGHALWLKQQAVCTNNGLALAAAKQLVIVRLSHIRETLRLRACATEVSSLSVLIAKVPKSCSLAELNGYEGAGTRLYFSAIADFIPEEMGFSGRNRRPPKDPFNAMLSLGYTILYGCVESLLRVDGLLPWCGFYHQPRGRHAALASDLMEPFRHVVERLALALLKRKEIKLNDFYFDDSGACFLSDSARRIFLTKLMAKFDSKIMAKSSANAKSLFEHIHDQNLELIRWLDHGGEFSPWQVR